jgi:hypothetical protein
MISVLVQSLRAQLKGELAVGPDRGQILDRQLP